MTLRRLRAWVVRLGWLFNQGRRDRELAEELECHLQMHIDDNVRAGMTRREARRLALIKLGGFAQTEEVCRRRRGLPMLEDLGQGSVARIISEHRRSQATLPQAAS